MSFCIPAPVQYRAFLPLPLPSALGSSSPRRYCFHFDSLPTTTITTSSSNNLLEYSALPPHRPSSPPPLMSCPRDIRPNEDDGWGYGDLHGTEEYPSISLLTESYVPDPKSSEGFWLYDFEGDLTTNAIPPNDPRFYAPPSIAPANITFPQLERIPVNPIQECAIDYQCGTEKHGKWIPCTYQCPHNVILPSLYDGLISGALRDIYDDEGEVRGRRVDVGAEVVPSWEVKRAGTVEQWRDSRTLPQLMEDMEKGLAAMKEIIQSKLETFWNRQAMRVEKRRSPKSSPRRKLRKTRSVH